MYKVRFFIKILVNDKYHLYVYKVMKIVSLISFYLHKVYEIIVSMQHIDK